jgi:sugar fermentation stimulation protein A
VKFTKPLIAGMLLRRYQRFLADIELEDGSVITAHTPNTGSMKGCCTPGSRVWLTDSGNPARKYPLSWELVEAAPDILVGINTTLPNRLVREGIASGAIPELAGYAGIRTEVSYGRENSRIDLLLEDGPGGACYVEVKNVTLAERGVGLFPDAVSKRGSKHLRELEQMAGMGHRAVIFYCVQRSDVREVRPADAIDPEYGAALRRAVANGVEALAYRAHITPGSVRLDSPVPVVCPDNQT